MNSGNTLGDFREKMSKSASTTKFYIRLHYPTLSRSKTEGYINFCNFFAAFSGGLSKFAKLARSVTRSRSALASQLSNQVVKETGKQSNLTQVINLIINYTIRYKHGRLIAGNGNVAVAVYF